MTIARMIIAGALLVSPVAAFADPAQPKATPASAVETAKDPNALICKKIDQLGSLIQTHRTCATAAQWKEYEYRAGQWNERMTSTRWLHGGG